MVSQQLDRWATHGYVDGFEEDLSANSSAAFWATIKDDGKPYWMTEGGTGGHDWPAPLNGVAAAVHNSLVAGNASAFVPWQVAGGRSKHSLMEWDKKTKKTYAMMHYSHWIDAGAQRLQVDGETDGLQVSAFLHEENGRLVVVVVNPGRNDEHLDLRLSGLAVPRFAVYRTSAEEDHVAIDALSVDDGAATLSMPMESIVTLVADGI